MSLSKEEQQQLAELEELDALQQHFGDNKSSGPAHTFDFLGATPVIGQALQGGANGFVDAAPAMAAGAAQGATFGFSDELGAGLDTGIDAAKQAAHGQVPDVLSMPEKWRQFQKSREAANKALAEESPIAYTGGELAGGVASALLTPEAAIGKGIMGTLGGAAHLPFSAGTKLVEGVGSLSPKLAAFLAGKTPQAMKVAEALKSGQITAKAAEAALAALPEASLATKIGGKAINLGIEGIPAGGLYGLGASENDISKPAELAMDMGSGMAMGSIGGLAIGGAAATGKELMKGVPKLANQYDFTRKLGTAYDLGQEGVSVDTSVGKQQIAKMNQDIPNEVTNDIMKADKLLGEKVGAALDNAEINGVKINVDPVLSMSSADVFNTFSQNPILLQTIDPKSKAILVKLGQGAVGDLSPSEAKALKDNMFMLVDKLKGVNSEVSAVARDKAITLGKALDAQMKKEIPDYALAASKFSEFRTKIPETILQPNLPMDKRTKSLGDLKNKTTDLFKGTSKILGEAHLPGSEPITGGARGGLAELQANLKALEQTSPEAVQAMGGTAEQVGSKWNNLADKLAVLAQSQGHEPREGVVKTFTGAIVGAGEGFAYNMANRTGKITKGLGQSAPVQASKNAFAAADNQLMGLAGRLKGSEASKPFGEALEKALANKDETAKNAVLFKLLQIPEYRAMLKGDDSNAK